MTNLRLLGAFPVGLMLLIAALSAIAAWWLYRREVRQLALGSASWLLPTLRATAIFLLVLTLAEPTIERRQREGDPGKIHFILDDSQSMSVEDNDKDDGESKGEALTVVMESRSGASRLERAATHLLNPSAGVLNQLAERFELTVSRFGSDRTAIADHANEPIAVWSSTLAKHEVLPASPTHWLPSSWGERSAIGDAVTSCLQKATTSDQAAGVANSAIVLLSDGQNNAGSSVLNSIGKQLDTQTPVYVIGYGSTVEPADIALVGWELPQRVYRTDTLSGSLVVNQRLPTGTRCKSQILFEGEVVWEEEFTADVGGRIDIPFSLAVAPLFDKQLSRRSRDANYANLPIPLEARLSAAVVEANSSNNQRRVSIDVAAQKTKILLVDGRSRWETRYLRNLFERDPAWEIDCVIASSDPTLSVSNARDEKGGTGLVALPTSREQLLDYNLILLGDTPANLWNADQLIWLSDFVEQGGGLILIDGSRNHLQDPSYQTIRPMYPVRWMEDSSSAVSAESMLRTELSDAGRGLSILKLSSDDEQNNAELWQKLPKLRLTSYVEPLPGSEVLIEAVSESRKYPLLVTRRFGGGRVLLLASDETWRWRYNVADAIHQRFWNQLARWGMRIPFSVQGEFASLDTGPSMAVPGKPVEVRCRLRELSGVPALNKMVTAIVRRDGSIVSRLPLTPVDELSGIYSQQLFDLQPGDYQVNIEAAGYPQQALAVESFFQVETADSREMDHIAQDDVVLRQLATMTGGQYLDESEFGRLVDLLEPHSSGRIVQSTTLLWQSYWWFGLAMSLLIVEWILRKRSGLI